MELKYRNAPIPEDPDAVRTLVAETGFFRPDEITVAVELVEERLAKGTESGYYFWFATHNGKPVGYVCYGPTPCTLGSFDLYWIVVGRDWQGRGLGLALNIRTEESVAAMGGRSLYVETSGKELYQSTRAFYEKAGYFRAAVLPDFYDIGDDKVIYQKNLHQPTLQQ